MKKEKNDIEQQIQQTKIEFENCATLVEQQKITIDTLKNKFQMI